MSAAPVPVLYVANASRIGGGNRVFMDLILGLDRARFAPLLAVPEQGPLLDWAAQHQLPYRVLPPGSGRIDVLRRTLMLARFIARADVRIVHASAPMAYKDASVAARLTNARRICHLGYPPDPGELEWTLRVAPDVVIACHRGQAIEVRDRVRATAPNASLVAVPNGIDVQRFSPRAAPRSAKPTVLIVGHLSEVKGYPTFFDAAAAINASGLECAFLALGGETASPGYRAVLDAQVQHLGLESHVTFLGWQRDVESVLQQASVVVMPSRAEGLPMALLEAMACGCAIVTTPVGGVPEAVTHEETALLVPPGDAGALGAAIMRLVQDTALARRLGSAARARAMSEFSVSRMVADVQRIYESLLPPGRTAPVGAEEHVATVS